MTTGEAKYPFFGIPPTRTPRPAAQEPALFGKRLILSTPEGFIEDIRAITERYVDDRNRDVVDVTSEVDYFAWILTDRAPVRKTWATHLVWVQP